MTEQKRAELLYNVVKELGHEVPPAPVNLELFYRNWFWVGGSNYTTDLGAAMALPMRNGDHLIVDVERDSFTASIEPVGGVPFVISRKFEEGTPRAEQFARAVCEVWLEYRRVMKGAQ